MNQRIIGVRIMLEGQHLLQVAMNDAEGRQLVRNFQEGVLVIKGVSPSGTCAVTGAQWWAPLNRVVGIHTFDWDAMLRAQQAQLVQQDPPPQQQPSWRPNLHLSGAN